MMTSFLRALTLTVSAGALSISAAAQASGASELRHIRGMSAYQGESELRSRGYRRVSSERSGWSDTTYWWDGRNCVQVEVYRNEVSSLRNRSDRSCNEQAGNNDSSGGGINRLVGMPESNAMESLERRGYRKVDEFSSGRTRYSVHWNSQANRCIQTTIVNGQIYSISNLRRHPNCQDNSYSRPVYRDPRIDWFDELAGDPAPASRQRLISAGFQSVFIENSGRRTIYYNRSSGQCLLMLAENRTVTSVSEIYQDTRCR